MRMVSLAVARFSMYALARVTAWPVEAFRAEKVTVWVEAVDAARATARIAVATGVLGGFFMADSALILFVFNGENDFGPGCGFMR
jgi:hypothetical protein